MTEKQRRPKPHHVDKGTVIGITDCACCAQKVQVKVNVSGKAYYNCNNFTEAGSCGYQVRYGAVKSEKMRRAYLERYETGRKDAPRVAANDNHPPQSPNVTRVTKEPSAPPPMPERKSANEDRAPVAPRTKKGALDEYGF